DSLETNKVNLSSWFSNIDMWKEDMEPTGRLTWLHLEGLPAIAWDAENVQKIGDKFGTVLEIDNMDVNKALKNSMGVLIVTKMMDEISKCVPIRFNECLCLIRVVEDHNRSFLLNLPTEFEYGASDDGPLNGDEDLYGFSDIDLGRREEGKYFSDDSQ
nr:nucleotide-binding alpha-beta plait domain-containing protein [Tanacetum cinerariifolium]